MIQRTTQSTDLGLKFIRRLLAILALVSLNTAFCQTTSGKLPKPSQDQVNHVASEKGLAYMVGNFKKIGTRLNLKQSIDCADAIATSKMDCTCLWQQRFEGGIEYQYNGCGGSVAETTITFSGYNKKEVIELIDNLFKTNNNIWNREKTQYKLKDDFEPKEGALTCDYEIKEEMGKVKLICICGWW